MNLSRSESIRGLPPDDGRDPRGSSSTREQNADRQQEERLAQHPFAVHVRAISGKASSPPSELPSNTRLSRPRFFFMVLVVGPEIRSEYVQREVMGMPSAMS